MTMPWLARMRLSRFAVAVAVALIAFVACDDRDNFRADVLLCEEAADHLESCCAHTPPLACEYSYDAYVSPSCDFYCDDDKEVVPDLSPSASRCVSKVSCETLRARGVCAATTVEGLRKALGDGGPCP